MLHFWLVQQEVLQPCMGVPNKVGRFPMVWKLLKVCYLGTSCMGRSLVHRPGPFGLPATSVACTMWEHSHSLSLSAYGWWLLCLWEWVSLRPGHNLDCPRGWGPTPMSGGHCGTGVGHCRPPHKARGASEARVYLCPWGMVTLVMGVGHCRPGYRARVGWWSPQHKPCCVVHCHRPKAPHKHIISQCSCP